MLPPTPKEEPIRIAILDMYNNVPNEGMRCIRQQTRDFFAREGVRGVVDVFNVRARVEVPGLEYDIYISTGGPGSPLLEDAPWEQPFFELMDRIFAHNRESSGRKKFLFLICHSFQLAVGRFRLGTVNKRKSTSFGVMPVHRTGEGFIEPLFYGLPEPFYVVDSRDYQVVQPDYDQLKALGAQIVAAEKIRPHVPLERAVMAIRFSDEVFGAQFHPEADSEGMLHYFITEEKKEHIIRQYGASKYYEMIQRLDDPDKIMLTESIILPRFLENAAHQLAALEAGHTSA
jgi:GMP synthase-like glutamine amidotransferase